MVAVHSGRCLSPFLTLALLLYFWGSGIADLDRFPTVHEDEPWIAAPGYTFWQKGYFGTDVFAGFYGMEHHYYQIPPLFSLMLGGWLHLSGLGLFQARLIPLICILLTLALTYRLGVVLFSGWHGLLAVAVLVGWSIARQPPRLLSGVPMADVARIARYDAAVPLFALSVLVVLVNALRKPSRLKFLLIGVLIGLAALSHLYGGFWLVGIVLTVILCLRWRSVDAIILIWLGFGAALLPWLLFIASNTSDFLNQNRLYAGRFRLSDPHFYLDNLAREWERYQPLTDALASGRWGTLLWLGGLAVGIVWLVLRMNNKRDQAASILLPLLGSMVILFALLLKFKTFTYLATMWPLFALVVACGWIGLWKLTRNRLWRFALIAIIFSAMFAGGQSTLRMHQFARATTPYRVITDQIAAYLPPDTRLLALQPYWFGLADRVSEYHSLLVPIVWTNPLYVAEPKPFAQVADQLAPTMILIDQPIHDMLGVASDPQSTIHELGLQILDYLNTHHARLLGQFDDPIYGKIFIYQLSP